MMVYLLVCFRIQNAFTNPWITTLCLPAYGSCSDYVREREEHVITYYSLSGFVPLWQDSCSGSCRRCAKR